MGDIVVYHMDQNHKSGSTRARPIIHKPSSENFFKTVVCSGLLSVI